MQLSMQLSLPVARPFSLRQTIAFLRRFPPCRGDYLLTEDSITAAVTVGGGEAARGVAFTIRGDREVTVEVPTQRDAAALVARAAHLVGAADDVAGFYAAAEGDAALRPIIERLYGLHHVRFLTLEEIAVYCVMMQRAPIAVASCLKRRFFERFAVPVEVLGAGGERATLRALPPLDVLAALDGAEIGEAIGHGRKGAQIASVVRGVAGIGERFLREAPYAEAREALLEVPGVGPFSAAAILLRGLGRMDDLPALPGLDEDLREVYGPRYDEAAIRRRYGDRIGYWAFYLKAGAARLREERAGTAVARPHRRQSGSPARSASTGAAHSV
jgi:DNA-3-methyladenine glycosylase II